MGFENGYRYDDDKFIFIRFHPTPQIVFPLIVVFFPDYARSVGRVTLTINVWTAGWVGPVVLLTLSLGSVVDQCLDFLAPPPRSRARGRLALELPAGTVYIENRKGQRVSCCGSAVVFGLARYFWVVFYLIAIDISFVCFQ